MKPGFIAMPSDDANHFWRRGVDAYGRLPEHAISDGTGIPCRHCLQMVAAGEAYLILAYRPFAGINPYTETGPIFLHAARCQRPAMQEALPDILDSDCYLLRGYSIADRIVEGTGGVVKTTEIRARAAQLLDNPNVAFVDVRSAANNCFQCRIVRQDQVSERIT